MHCTLHIVNITDNMSLGDSRVDAITCDLPQASPQRNKIARVHATMSTESVPGST